MCLQPTADGFVDESILRAGVLFDFVVTVRKWTFGLFECRRNNRTSSAWRVCCEVFDVQCLMGILNEA